MVTFPVYIIWVGNKTWIFWRHNLSCFRSFRRWRSCRHWKCRRHKRIQNVCSPGSSGIRQGVRHFSWSKWKRRLGIQRSLNPESKATTSKLSACAKSLGTGWSPYTDRSWSQGMNIPKSAGKLRGQGRKGESFCYIVLTQRQKQSNFQVRSREQISFIVWGC